jgi:hypothetical protein
MDSKKQKILFSLARLLVLPALLPALLLDLLPALLLDLLPALLLDLLLELLVWWRRVNTY